MTITTRTYCTDCDETTDFESDWEECKLCGGHIEADESECCNGCGLCDHCEKWVKYDALDTGWCDECNCCKDCCTCPDEEGGEDEVVQEEKVEV